MLEDRDLFPITCTRCRQQTYKELGRLKSEGRIVCSDCGLRMRFNRDEFVRVIEQARKLLANRPRDVGPSD